ncbi:SGNH/GDSL hydrolase N-terminal domain-containing protein [uncultured Bacteroides sp.]|nr:SGNH/GDSL hydrolase N-terminal domain-containing protein [uncultured Bacteroides sp.]
MVIRFRSNSSQIVVKWKLSANSHMSHMTDVGVKTRFLLAWKKSIGVL